MKRNGASSVRASLINSVLPWLAAYSINNINNILSLYIYIVNNIEFYVHRREKSLSSASSLLFFFMSRKRAVDSSRSREGRKPGNTFFPTISISDQIWRYLTLHISSITYLITFLTSIFLHVEAGRDRLSKRTQSKTEKVNGWNAETTDVKYNNYMLLALIFDSFIELFVPFTSLCPNLSPTSFDVATLLRSRDVKRRRIQVWT